MTWSALIKSITRREWKIVLGLSALAMILAAVPPVFGYLLGLARGLHWNGLQQLSPGDFSVYVSYIRQAQSGQLLLQNMFTVEPTAPAFNWFWWAVGRFAAFFDLGPLAAFYLVRAWLVPPLAVTLYLAISFFYSAVRERLLAFVLMFFGSGLGIYFAPFFLVGLPSNSPQWPIDLWVAEANVFASLTYSPHFIASWTLLLLTLLLLLLGFSSGRWRYGLLSGVTAALLFQFHPFHAPTVYLLGALYLLILLVRQRKILWPAVGNYCLLLASSAPVLLYHYLVMTADRQGRMIIAANQTPTPWLWHLLIGFGVLSVAASIGVWLFYRRRLALPDWIFLALWSAVQIILVYLPFVFQRRLLEGLQFPLVLLSVPVIILAWEKFVRWSGYPRAQQRLLAAILFLVLCLPTSFRMIAGNIDLYWNDGGQLAYFSAAEKQALDWIAANTPPEAAFVSHGASGHNIVAWGERRVLFGHWVNSGDSVVRAAEVNDFFAAMDDGQRTDFMEQRGIGYIYYGPEERQLGAVVPSGELRRVFTNQEIEIFLRQ